jgi:hypothetical protein
MRERQWPRAQRWDCIPTLRLRAGRQAGLLGGQFGRVGTQRLEEEDRLTGGRGPTGGGCRRRPAPAGVVVMRLRGWPQAV